jgi:hypothetical protein
MQQINTPAAINFICARNHSIVVVHIDGVTLCLWTAVANGPIVHPQDDIWEWRAMVEWYWQGKTEESGRETCPSAILSTTNPTLTDLGANPGLCWKSPVTNRLSHDTWLLLHFLTLSLTDWLR